MNRYLALAALALFACAPAKASTGTGKVRVINYCDFPGVSCLDIDDAPDVELVELKWCCGYDGSPCVLVQYVHYCDPEAEYAVICEWGRLTEEGQIECYD